MRSIRNSGFTNFTLILVGIVAVIAVGCLVLADWWVSMPTSRHADFVGRDTCAKCHQTQVEKWVGSDHDLAMDHATPETVLGDFANATLEHLGVTSTMFRRDGHYFVHTEGPTGAMADFEVKYVFGFEPLQQYLVEFDRGTKHKPDEISRLQALRIAWDTEKKTWFYLSPPDVTEKLDPNDPLHWTGSAQNWNHMCASCHSTNLQKGYDVASQTYHTTWSEIDVSCEACHGPGSLHVELATSVSLFWDRKLGYGLKRLKSDDSHVEIESCAPCHSRRRTVHPDAPPGQNYYDCYANELLSPTTYYADGQILDEVYVYGSFVQSKMFHQGVRCTDCHDPHTTKLKLEGNALCVSCHSAHPQGKYDTPAHHRHQVGSAGAQCVNCHMPATPYMEVDFRRDHSIRVPRPKLSVDLGTPNACTGCHLDVNRVSPEKRAALPHYAAWMNQSRAGDAEVKNEIARVDRWAAKYCQQWYGPDPAPGNEHFGYTLSQAWGGSMESVGKLVQLARGRMQPGIVRASAMSQLAELDPTTAAELSPRLLREADPQVRIAAVSAMETAAPAMRLRELTPRLLDPVRAVRAEAARLLAEFGPDGFDSEHRIARDQALDEYQAGLQQNSDMAMSHMAQAILEERQGKLKQAANSYRTAILVQPSVTGPRTNLAALIDRIVRQSSPTATQTAAAQQEIDRLRREELPLLARDARYAPDSAPIQYRYGLALYLSGDLLAARKTLTTACAKAPENEEFRLGLTLLLERMEIWKAALESAQILRRIAPQQPGYEELEQRISEHLP